jgi:hypothetical protein
MKILVPACLLLLALSSCGNYNAFGTRRRAIDSVEDYLSRHLSHPGTYRDLGYGELIRVDDNYEANTSLEGYKYGLMGYYINHTYKIKTLSGNIVTCEQRFILNRDCSVHVVRERIGY